MYPTRYFQSLPPFLSAAGCVLYRETSLWHTLRMCIWQRAQLGTYERPFTETLTKETLDTSRKVCDLHISKSQTPVSTQKWGDGWNSSWLIFFSRSRIQNSLLLVGQVPCFSWSFCVKKEIYGRAAQLQGTREQALGVNMSLQSSLSSLIQLNRWLISSEKGLLNHPGKRGPCSIHTGRISTHRFTQSLQHSLPMFSYGRLDCQPS